YGCFQEGSAVITPPADGQFGNMGRNIFRGPAFHNWDMSVTKLWKLSEHMQLQMRGEFFNILNHTNFAGVTTDLSDAVFGTNDVGLVIATPDVYASNPVIGSGGSRHIQVGPREEVERDCDGSDCALRVEVLCGSRTCKPNSPDCIANRQLIFNLLPCTVNDANFISDGRV